MLNSSPRGVLFTWSDVTDVAGERLQPGFYHWISPRPLFHLRHVLLAIDVLSRCYASASDNTDKPSNEHTESVDVCTKASAAETGPVAGDVKPGKYSTTGADPETSGSSCEGVWGVSSVA